MLHLQHDPLKPPFLRSAAWGKVGSEPTSVASQHTPNRGHLAASRTAHSGPSPGWPSLRRGFTEAAFRGTMQHRPGGRGPQCGTERTSDEWQLSV